MTESLFAPSNLGHWIVNETSMIEMPMAVKWINRTRVKAAHGQNGKRPEIKSVKLDAKKNVNVIKRSEKKSEKKRSQQPMRKMIRNKRTEKEVTKMAPKR